MKLEIPFNIGDTIYAIVDRCPHCHDSTDWCHISCKEKSKRIIVDIEIEKIIVDKISGVEEWKLDGYNGRVSGNDFNKTWFLTKQEAEERLLLLGEDD